MTEEEFKRSVGRLPEKDDLERVNCGNEGTFGHWSCGWCNECNNPRFLCGHFRLMNPTHDEKAFYNLDEHGVHHQDAPIIPKGWTYMQAVSARRVCIQQNVPFVAEQWAIHFAEGGYIMNTKPINKMFIGIEGDGYAHT